DLLGGRLLAAAHHFVDHLRDEGRVVDGIRLDRPGLDFCTARHYYEPFLAPYLERPCLRSDTPAASSAARITLYRTPGRSLTRPPRTSTTECSWRLWPSPGMYVPTSIPFVSRTRAILRSAEFGFLGVIVDTRVHTPRFWGAPWSAGVLVFSRLVSRPLRISWLTVGMSPLLGGKGRIQTKGGQSTRPHHTRGAW